MIKGQIKSLEHVSFYLINLTDDQINFIKSAYPNTGLKTQIIYLLFDMKERLKRSIEPELYHKFNCLKSHCIAHIQKRINQLSDSTTEMSDLLAPLDDLIFACQEVVNLKLFDLWGHNQAVEIVQFQKNIFPMIEKKLPVRGQQDSVDDILSQLSQAYENNDFTLASKLLEKIESINQHLS